MTHPTATRDGQPVGFGTQTREALRRSVGTRARTILLAVTLLLGLLVAVAVAASGAPEDRTLSGVSLPAQSVMSVLVPLFGVLLAHDLPRGSGRARLAPTLLGAVLLAAGIGLVGLLCSVAAVTLVAPSDGDADPWRHAGTVAVGSVLVQVLAQLVGTGFGLLVRSRAVAFLGTIVLPLGCWALFGAVDVLRPAQAFTPFDGVGNLLSGEMSAVRWAQWLGTLLIWGVGLNALGAARRDRSDRAAVDHPH
ncbi:hypothetical protein ACFY3U_12935 [Micromonospora sp. NPDC000089]|uniref:hypothetical protein n=1 Tax=unclassified Micromonospora TaxID=2617518 RepID=UPI0036764224